MNNKHGYQIIVSAESGNLKQVLHFIRQGLDNHNILISNDIQLAVEEIFINITSYSYDNKDGSVTIQAVIEEDPAKIIITFIDNGKPFDPRTAKIPNVTLPIAERNVGGLGIFIVKHIVDSLEYQYVDQKNVLTISKYL